ncbi:hypothetical protein KKF84_19275 [Myxococcota bacterium]|nr:hypothetical protein [Myxococcota bacterium]MBU1537465.1 hypothetical protein [Myxococcota bacterium]
MALTVIITGKPSAGKTTLLTRCVDIFGATGTTGVLCPSGNSGEIRHSSADRYYMRSPASPKKHLWAERLPGEVPPDFSREMKPNYRFYPTVREKMEARVRSRLERGDLLCWLLDDIGPLELAGEGWAPLLHRRDTFHVGILILVVKKRLLPEIVSTFSLEDHLLIDLDHVSPAEAIPRVEHLHHELETRRVGEYAGMCGTMEIGLGSLLHGLRIPFKGHFLALLQNAMLILAGNSMGGRGLFRVTCITAMLKSFSPMHNPLRPMISIALQGSLFSTITMITRWRLFGVLLASILMGWLTIGLGLLFQYMLFGHAFVLMMAGFLGAAGRLLGVTLSPLGALLWLLGVRAAISIVVALVAWYGHLSGLLMAIEERWTPMKPRLSPLTENSWGRSALLALRDLLRPWFVLFLALSGLLLFVFSPLDPRAGALVFARGALLAFVFFTLQHRVPLSRLLAVVQRRGGENMGRAMAIAVKKVSSRAGSDK